MKIVTRKKGSFVVTPISFNRRHINSLVDTGSPITILDNGYRNLNKPYQYETINGINGRTKARKYTDYVTITDTDEKQKEILTEVYFMDLSAITDNYGKTLYIRAIVGMDLLIKTKLLQCSK